MKFSAPVKELLESFGDSTATDREAGDSSVSHTISTLAVLYEKARNAIEFRADHLVRRAAIERIIKRRLLTNKTASTIAENLLLELLWAKYIDSSLVDEQTMKKVTQILDRYLLLKSKHFTRHLKNTSMSWETVLGIASSEIDEAIFPAHKRDALVKFFYLAIRPKIQVDGVKTELMDTYVYIAIGRTYIQADDNLILFHLLKMSQPGWFISNSGKSSTYSKNLIKALEIVEKSLKDPIVNKIQKYIRKQMPPFLLLRDFLLESEDDVTELVGDKEEFNDILDNLARRRYLEIGVKVKRSIIRSFIYIFLTKMVFALALELPYDLYVIKEVVYLPLAVNTLFPPFILVFLAGLFSVPDEKNTKKLIMNINAIIYNFETYRKNGDRFILEEPQKRPVLTTIFSAIYLGTFALTFGLINAGLTALNFSFVSKVIFVFFLAIVSFFAYHIRLSSREYSMEEKQSLFGTLIDFFFLPILLAGQVVSRGMAKLNMFVFFFDFILEAPLKTVFEFLEEWFRFISMKREEII